MLFFLAQAAEYTLFPGEPLPEESVWFRLGLAAVFGIVIGWERRISEKPADVRTMALVSASAAAFTLLGVQLGAQFEPGQGFNLDPTRIISYIISGVGFLGAGAILHSKRTVRGLTTAASIWAAAAIGAACGLGAFVIAGTLFVITIIMLWGPWLTRVSIDDDDRDHRRRL